VREGLAGTDVAGFEGAVVRDDGVIVIVGVGPGDGIAGADFDRRRIELLVGDGDGGVGAGLVGGDKREKHEGHEDRKSFRHVKAPEIRQLTRPGGQRLRVVYRPSMSEKIIRDPVHDVIAFRTERPADALLFRLINAAEFQRLRRIRQLGMASLAYPGADHSRYSHSLGVMETARKILDQLKRSGVAIDEENETVCLAAALLHDLGHGPFSHVFERVSGVNHEQLTERVILDPESDVHHELASHDAQLPERIVDFMEGRPQRSFYCDVLSSQLDADRFDYLLRDNLMTGSRYGGYDLRWLLHALTVHEGSDRLAVTWKGVSAVEAYLQSRYHMYRNVYFHKVVRSAEGMVKLALQRAKRLAVQDRLEWPRRDETVYKALLGQRLTIEEFTDLDDVSVLHCLKLWVNSHDVVLARLSKGLLFRQVYKTIDLSHVTDESRVRAMITTADNAVAAAGGEAGYDVFFDEATDTPYEIFADAGQCGGAGEIIVLDPSGKPTDFARASPFVRALNSQLMFRRLHVAAEWRDVAQRAL
jgi:HD superfamily phosphohydrolase